MARRGRGRGVLEDLRFRIHEPILLDVPGMMNYVLKDDDSDKKKMLFNCLIDS